MYDTMMENSLIDGNIARANVVGLFKLGLQLLKWHY